MATKAYTVAELYVIARKAGFSPGGAVKAAMVGMAESSGRAGVTSANPDGGTNVGIMQLDTKGVGSGYTVSQLSDPLTNMKIAFKASNDGANWSQWATWPDAADKFKAPAVAAADQELANAGWLDKIWGGIQYDVGTVTGTAGAVVGQLLQLPAQVTDMLTALEKPVQALQWFVNPVNWARLLSGLFGLLLLVAGLITLGMAA